MAVPIKFQNVVTDNSKTQLRNALNCRGHAHSTSIAIARSSVGALHDNLRSNDFYFTSVVERTTNTCLHEQESPILTTEKIVSITCTSLFVMKYCNYRDITSVYSLNSWKLPGRFSSDPTAWKQCCPLSGLDTRLLTYIIVHLIPCVKLYHCSECPCSL